MKPLPAGLAEPLHLLTPFDWRPWAAAGLVLLAIAALAAYLYVKRRRGMVATRPQRAAPLPRPPRAPASGIAAAIRDLRSRYLGRRQFRAGCHELSSVLREHFESRGRHRYSALTAREIGQRLGDTPVSRLLALLAELQFGRREPAAGDLVGICDIALEVVTRSGGSGR